MNTLLTLRTYLKERNLGPNEQLPSERQLAEELGLTRGQLRTSLAKLEREGMIWRHVGQGTFMRAHNAPPHSPSSPASADIRSAFETNPPEILEARLVLEPQIAHLAALRAVGSDIDNLKEIIEASKVPMPWEEWSALDKTFHLTLARTSKNQLLFSLLVSIQESQTLRNWGELSDLPAAKARRDDINREHEQIFLAVRSRASTEAATQMRQHLENVRKALLGIFSSP